MAASAVDAEMFEGLPSLELSHQVSEKNDTLKKEESFNNSLEKAGEDQDQYNDDVELLNGEPVITSGRDVSRFVVDMRDDGDPALTFRSLFLGTVMAGLGAALCQVRAFSPVLGCELRGPLGADIFVQARADVSFDCVPVAHHLYLW